MQIVKLSRYMLIVAGFASLAGGAPAVSRSQQNLCYNGTFDVPDKPLDGWMIDYRWTGNSHYAANHTRVSAVASHKGKRNVMRIKGGAETKVESAAIPFEQGARYQCTLNLMGSMPHIYFSGYKWKPGIRPHEKPHLGDLRRIYKSQFRNTKVSSGGGGWKKVTFEFPLPNLSDLAKKHLKYVRFCTVYIIVINDASGEIYVDDVVVTKIN